MALGSAKGGDMDVSLVSDESRAGSSYEGPKFECEFAHASRAAHEARAGCPFFEACTRFHILKVAPGLDVVAPIIVLDAQIHADSLGRGQTPRMVAKELQASLSPVVGSQKRRNFKKMSFRSPCQAQSSPVQVEHLLHRKEC